MNWKHWFNVLLNTHVLLSPGKQVEPPDRTRSQSCTRNSAPPIQLGPATRTDAALFLEALNSPHQSHHAHRRDRDAASSALPAMPPAARRHSSFSSKGPAHSAPHAATDDCRPARAPRAAPVGRGTNILGAPCRPGEFGRDRPAAAAAAAAAASSSPGVKGSWTTRLHSTSLADLLGFLRTPEDDLVRGLAGRTLDDRFDGGGPGSAPGGDRPQGPAVPV